MRRNLSVWALLVAFAVFSWPALGDDKSAATSTAPAKQQPGVANETKPFDKTVRLEFKLQGYPNDPVFFVLCGASDYSLRYGITKPDTEFNVRIDGALKPVNDSGRFLLTFKSELHLAKPNDGNEAQYSASGSALIEPGKPKRLATLGDGTLTVTATLED